MTNLPHKEKGFTILVAIVLTATLLLISTAIATLATRESVLSNSAVQSQYAFYAADTGIECALYWDVKGSVSAFATTTSANTIRCNQDLTNPTNTWTVGGSALSNFRMTFLPDTYCADVTVTKSPSGSTSITSSGYNTCSVTDPRRVSRTVRVDY